MDEIEDGLELPAANSRFYELIKKTPYKKGVGFDVTNLTDDEKSEFKELKESSGFLNDDDVFVSLQQYRNGGLVGDPPEKKSKLVDFTDVTWTDKDLEYANENLLCFDGQCLDRSLQAYDKVVASYLPGMPSSSKFKKDYGFQSAPKYEKYEDTWTDKIVEKAGYEGDPSTGKISYVSVGGAKKPVSDKTQKWFESQRGFDVKNSDFTVDSWDYSGVLKDEGGQVIFTESNKDFFSNKSEKEKSDIYKKLPIGTHIGYGSREGRADIQYNKEKGLSSSSHSAIVVGYNEDGLPIVYDYDQYKPINTKGIYGEDQITNIVIPKHSIGKDREYFAKQNLLLKESAPLDLDLTELYKQGDKNELNVFYRTLVANKENLMNDLKIDSKTYDDYAKNLLAISMQETGGGTSIEHNIFGDTFGSTHGLTQLNRKNILDDEQLKNIADKYGINENTNLSDPRRHAIASMIYHKRHQIAADKAYEQGLNPSIRTYRQVGNDFFKDVARSMQSKSHAYKNNVFRTDEGTEIDMFSGINYLGLGSQKSIEKIQSELDAVKKDKYRAYKKDGEILIDKKTLGNYKLDKKGNKIKMSPSDRAIYAWSGFKTLKYGDAQGDNAYYKNVKKYRDLIKDRNETNSKFRNGGTVGDPPEKKLKNRILKEYPGFKSILDKTDFYATDILDSNKTSFGDTETMGPNQDAVRYSYSNPNYKDLPNINYGTGRYAVYTNPFNVDISKSTIPLASELFHALGDTKENATNPVLHSLRQDIIDRGNTYNYFKERSKKNMEDDGGDDINIYDRIQADGIMRNILYNDVLNRTGDESILYENRYDPLETKELTSHYQPMSNQIINYLQNPQGYPLPQINVTAKRK